MPSLTSWCLRCPVQTSSAECPRLANLALRCALHSNPIWSEPNPSRTITAQGTSANQYCNAPANRQAPADTSKSLKVKEREGDSTGTPFRGQLLRDNFDVSVKPPPLLADKRPPSFAAGSQHPSFLLKTGRMADSRRTPPMDIQMLHGTKVEKRRSPVSYSSTSTNRGRRPCAGAPDSRFHPSGGLNKNVRP